MKKRILILRRFIVNQSMVLNKSY